MPDHLCANHGGANLRGKIGGMYKTSLKIGSYRDDGDRQLTSEYRAKKPEWKVESDDSRSKRGPYKDSVEDAVPNTPTLPEMPMFGISRVVENNSIQNVENNSQYYQYVNGKKVAAQDKDYHAK